MQTYGVSDGTVKRAIAKLREDRLVESVVGRGVYVAEKNLYRLRNLWLE